MRTARVNLNTLIFTKFLQVCKAFEIQKDKSYSQHNSESYGVNRSVTKIFKYAIN